MKKVFCVACSAVGISLFAVTAAFPLENSVVSRIRQANTSGQLASQAERIVRDEASMRPKDFQEGTQIAAETSAYLMYIQVKQNDLIIKKLSEIAAQNK